MTFQPSAYQERIFDFVTNGRGDGIVNAVAGAGKTTTLVEAARLIKSSSALFVAFNKHIAETLNSRLDSTPMVAKTVHSIGYGCVARSIGRPRVEERKYGRICADWVEDHIDEWQVKDAPTRTDAISQLKSLVNMARLTLTNGQDRDALRETAERYSVEYHPVVLSGVAAVLRRGEQIAKTRGEIDYTDMLWLPHHWKLQPPQVDWLMADEIQDFSEAQLQLLLKCRAPGGRGLWVGDPQQAIMAFAFAGCDSFERIKAATQATELPLSICYRCPESHLALARRIVPHIEARPGAPLGAIDIAPADSVGRQLREGDLVLCRLTAPLISLCIQLIAQRLPARVRGRDIAKQLTDMVRSVAQLKDFVYPDFVYWLNVYRHQHLTMLMQKDASQAQIESLHDRCDGLTACYQAFQASNIDALCIAIEGLFSDDRASIWLSTIHRAKGLEEERVFILNPEKLPFQYAKQSPEQYQQELNLAYVALTRAKRELTFVGELPAIVA